MNKIKSQGKCFFCNKEFSKAGITRHLNTHLSGKTTDLHGKSFHLKIELDNRYGSTPYFLNLWIDGNATFESLDNFLRRIWLECCGHMSSFTNPKNRRRIGAWSLSALDDDDDDDDEITVDNSMDEVLTKDLKLIYQYDFGSTTQLQITVANEFLVSVEKGIVLLSRNEPLEIICEICKAKPATQICSICTYKGENAFCDTCAKKHAKKCPDFADYATMPVVNSPRMGVCAYDGGRIDIERDGAYVKK